MGPLIQVESGHPGAHRLLQLSAQGTLQPHHQAAQRRPLPSRRPHPHGGRNRPSGRQRALHREPRRHPSSTAATPPGSATVRPTSGSSPAGEVTSYKTGDTYANVPDMPNPGQGAETLYYTNDISGRLMFYHDHAVGITRLNVYAGMVAGLPDHRQAGVGENYLIGNNASPLKPTPSPWSSRTRPSSPTTSPRKTASGTPTTGASPATSGTPTSTKPTRTPTPSTAPTPPAAGTTAPGSGPSSPPPALPDRRLRQRQHHPGGLRRHPGHQRHRLPDPHRGPQGLPLPGPQRQQRPLSQPRPLYGRPDPDALRTPRPARPIPATAPRSRWSPSSPAPPPSRPPAGSWGPAGGTPDARVGGIPDPATAGPDIIQIGNEGGLLPPSARSFLPTPINYEYNKRSVTVLNVLEHGLYLGPAERSDIVVDFSQFAGQTLILYNDAPAPLPAGDPRLDYYTGDPDFTDSGGAPPPCRAIGPNTRTIMQIKVTGTVRQNGTPYDAGDPAGRPAAAYAQTQPRPVVPGRPITRAFGEVSPTTMPTIFTGSLMPTMDFIAPSTSFNHHGDATVTTGLDFTYSRPPAPRHPGHLGTTPPRSPRYREGRQGQQAHMPVQNKAIQELFDPYGRMNATLGVELPFTSSNIQTTVPLGYIDPHHRDHRGRRDPDLEDHPQRRRHPSRPLPPGQLAADRPGRLGRHRQAAGSQRVGLEGNLKMNPLEDVIVAVRPTRRSSPSACPTASVPSRRPSPSAPPTAS